MAKKRKKAAIAEGNVGIGPTRRALACAVVQRRGVWLERFLDPRGFGKFAEELGFESGMERWITTLWWCRLLLADYVSVESDITPPPGLRIVADRCGKWDGRGAYSDSRSLPKDPASPVGSLKDFEAPPPGVVPYFHPFRYVVLHGLAQCLQPSRIATFQALFSESSAQTICKMIWQIPQAQTTTSFWPEVRRLNDLAAFLIMSEPTHYPRVVQMSGGPLLRTPEQHRADHKQHAAAVQTLYRRAGLEQLQAERERMVRWAEIEEPNRNVHILLRLAAGKIRRELKGSLGIAVLLKGLAEMVRRGCAAHIKGEALPCEEHIGFSSIDDRVMQEAFGASSIVDAEAAAKEAYLRHFRLDYSTQVRWYVEGATEFGAVSEAADALGAAHIEIIDLKAQFIANSRKNILGFRDSLRRDQATQVLSFVSVDTDRDDNLRALRRAAEDEEITGRVFLSAPDFEMANFSLNDLVEVVLTFANADADKGVLRQQLCASQSLRDLHTKARALGLEVGKSESWGRALMRFALANPTTTAGTQRGVVKAVWQAAAARLSSYRYFRQRYRMCPTTLGLQERPASPTESEEG